MQQVSDYLSQLHRLQIMHLLHEHFHHHCTYVTKQLQLRYQLLRPCYCCMHIMFHFVDFGVKSCDKSANGPWTNIKDSYFSYLKNIYAKKVFREK